MFLDITRSPDLETHEVHDALHLGAEVIHATTLCIFLQLREAIEDLLHPCGFLLDSLLLEFILQLLPKNV